jgi:hypothetical protein
VSTQSVAASTGTERVGAEASTETVKRLIKAALASLGRLIRGSYELLPERATECSVRSKMDVRVASPRKLFRDVHDFLEEDGFGHDYEPLKAERDAIGDVAIFKSELAGKMDSQARDVFSLILGILLIFTIVLIPLAIRLLRESRYTLRTVVEIGVEGEAYRYRHGTTGAAAIEVLEVVSDARVTLHVKTGVAADDAEISRPSRVRGERRRIALEQQDLRESFERLLISKALPILETVGI